MLTERLQLSPLCSVVSGVNEIIEQLKKEGKDLDKRLSAREKAEAHGDFYSACFLTRASDTELSSACSHACMPGCMHACMYVCMYVCHVCDVCNACNVSSACRVCNVRNVL